MFYDSSEEFRAVAVLTLVAMVENRISGIERQIEMKIVSSSMLYRSYQVILSIANIIFKL